MLKIFGCLVTCLVVTTGVVGCATMSPQTRELIQHPPDIPNSARVDKLKYIEQVDGDCGPAALTAVMNWAGLPVMMNELRSEVYTASRNGALPIDLVSASRRRGLMAIPISGLSALLREVAQGHPVIVFENLGLSWAAKWHYAVVTGFDLKEQKIIFLSKSVESESLPMTYFERYWQLADYWGLVVLPPSQLSETANELTHMQAASGLEQAGHVVEAEVAYKKILERWPQSLMALIGLGNMTYQRRDYAAARRYLKKAVELHPESASARHNLSVALSAGLSAASTAAQAKVARSRASSSSSR